MVSEKSKLKKKIKALETEIAALEYLIKELKWLISELESKNANRETIAFLKAKLRAYKRKYKKLKVSVLTLKSNSK